MTATVTDIDPTTLPTRRRTDTVLLIGPSTLRHEALGATGREMIAATFRSTANPSDNTLVLTADNAAASYYRIGPHGSRGNDTSATLGRIARACDTFGDLAPLFLLTALPDGRWQPFTQLSYVGSELLFLRLDGEPLQGDPANPATVREWTDDLAARHRAHGPHLNNHQRWFTNARPDTEIEQKFTLLGAPDIWRLALEARDLIGAGNLPGWILEPGGGFEQWDFLNHLHAISGPPGEEGHIAYIPAVNGSWISRRKWGADGIQRREVLTEGLDLGRSPDLRQIIADHHGVDVDWSATYRRVRYNVLMEATRTGHIFSVMFDRCTVQDRPDIPALHQAEVEYVRSRTLTPAGPADGLMDDFAALTDWTRAWLASRAIRCTEHHLSKATWLRTHLAT
ncbi:hypothetical protein [Streptomyces sp. NRRL B-24484]|uniref:hypothetical protein n=1 Tax=Streptomyces sp. NRRL B-24484 TaxID=1463833 RepID=UPI0004C200BA|nr:hypothetical protein [Streptomyces sp. NRRL B-24484]